MIYALLVDADPAVRADQLAHLDANAEAGVPEYLAHLLPLTEPLDAPHRLTLLDMSMPALKSLSKPQYHRFVDNTVALIRGDRRIDLLEWVLHRILLKELKPHFEGPLRTRARYRRVAAVAEPAGVLLSALARLGHPQESEARAAFARGAAELELELDFDAEEDSNFSRLNVALRELRRLKPLAKPQIIKACVATAMHDDSLIADEIALLRGVSATLDCPLPPSIYEQVA